MAIARYLFGDLSTGQIIAELPCTSVSMDKTMNAVGNFRATMRFDSSGIDNQDIVDATTPGKCFVVCQLEETPIWDGIIWTRTYDSLGKDLNLTARTYDAYAEHNLIGSFVRLGIEQRNIFRDLWNDLQSSDDRNLSINVPAAFDTVLTRDLTVMSSEYKTYLQVMSSIADGDDGFDWTIDTTLVDNQYVRNLRIGYPTLGSLDSGLMSFDYPGAITNYWKTDGMSNAATHLFLLGSGEGDAMIIGTAVQGDMIVNGFKRYDLTVSRKDLSDQGLANSLANQLGKQRRPPLSTIKVMLKADLEPIFGSYQLGDTAVLSIIDPRHPYPGLTNNAARIVAWSYSPQSDDTTEQAELIFEGDELNN